MAKQNPNPQQGQQGSLEENFNWEDENTFFGIKDTEENVDDYFRQQQANDETATKSDDDSEKDKKPKEDEPEEEIFFDDNNVAQIKDKGAEGAATAGAEGKGEAGAGGSEETPEDDELFTALAGDLKEKGILRSLDIPEGTKLTEEQLHEAVDQEVEARYNEAIEALTEGFEQDMKDFIQFRKAGGSAEIFLNNYFAAFTPELDLTDVEQQKVAVRQYLQQMVGEDAAEVETQIQYLTDNAKLKSAAEKYYAKLKQADEAQRAEVMRAAEQQQLKAKADREKFETNIKKTLTDTNQIGDFSLAKIDKKALGDYITKPTVKVGKNKFITPFQEAIGKLFQSEDKSNLIIIAKLLQSNFDVKDLVAKAATEKVEKTQTRVQQARSGTFKKTTAVGERNKTDITQFF